MMEKKMDSTIMGLYKVVSHNKGTLYRPQYTIILIMGTLNKVPLILGNTHKGFRILGVGTESLRYRGLGLV